MNRNRKSPAAAPAPGPAPVDLSQVVSAYADQAKAADALAAVDTKRLDTPTANPNVLATLNAERDAAARERIELDYARQRITARDEHQVLVEEIAQRSHRATALTARSERAVTEGLADADEAAAELAEVRAFERGASPATATRRLMKAVKGWRKEEFAYAIAGSALSAAGVTALVTGAATLPLSAGAAVAIALEVVLTVRVIRLIGQRAELAEQHKGQPLTQGSAGAKALTFLTAQIVALLAVSVLLNLTGLVFFDTSVLGVLGALGAGAAALASWSAWQASVAAAETVRSNVTAWQGGDWASAREELRSRAAGAHIPVPEDRAHSAAPGAVPGGVDPAQLRTVLAALAEEHLAALADRGTDALAAMLDAAPPAGGGAPARTGGGAPPGAPLEPRVESPVEQGGRVEPLDGRQAVLEAITDPDTGLGAEASNSAVGRAVGLSRTVVRKHRVRLWSEGEPVFPPGYTIDADSE